jgi:hypothetical protein
MFVDRADARRSPPSGVECARRLDETFHPNGESTIAVPATHHCSAPELSLW